MEKVVERLGFVEIPYLELLDAVLEDKFPGIIDGEARREIVLTYGQAIKEAVKMKTDKETPNVIVQP